MQSRIDLTWFISGNDHVNVCANYQSDWSDFVSDFGEELLLGHENAYSSGLRCGYLFGPQKSLLGRLPDWGGVKK